MKFHLQLATVGLLPILFVLAAQAASPPLIIVENRGGTSALPYYQALNLQSPQSSPVPSPRVGPAPQPQGKPYSEADMLPVRSARLSVGDEPRRVIQAPGLRPLFLIGDDPRSRAWLKERLATLRDLQAVGLVVQVETPTALASLRALAPDLTLMPASGDDMAARLSVRHYPVLITATGIEQ